MAAFRQYREAAPAIIELLPKPALPAPIRHLPPDPEQVVAAYRALAQRLLIELGEEPSQLALNRCLLFLTLKYREARRAAPQALGELETIWDEACSRTEFLAFKASPPALDPPPPPPPKRPPRAERQQSLLELLLEG